MSTDAERLDRLERMYEDFVHWRQGVRAIRPRANSTGGSPVCIYEHDPEDCPVASVDIYQNGCRGADCSDQSAAYYALYRDDKKLQERVAKRAAKAKVARTEDTPVEAPRRRAPRRKKT